MVPDRSAIPIPPWGSSVSARASMRPASASRGLPPARPAAETVWSPATSVSPAAAPTAWRTWERAAQLPPPGRPAPFRAPAVPAPSAIRTPPFARSGRCCVTDCHAPRAPIAPPWSASSRARAWGSAGCRRSVASRARARPPRGRPNRRRRGPLTSDGRVPATSSPARHCTAVTVSPTAKLAPLATARTTSIGVTMPAS